ncbi:unnamed protein product, partial [marine sediment metagenome]
HIINKFHINRAAEHQKYDQYGFDFSQTIS